MEVDLSNGSTTTPEQMRAVAAELRTAPPPDIEWAALMVGVAWLEALAKTKDDLDALRREFEALKSTIRHDGR